MINFSELYDSQIDNLFAFGTRFTADRELIKDCIQDVFIKLFTKRDYLDSVTNIQSYLFISLRNRINDEFRKNSHNIECDLNDNNVKDIIDSDADLELQELQSHRIGNMKKYVKFLSPRQQQIIQLYYIEQRKYEDICEVMGINYQSVRNLMHRSLSRLRSLALQDEEKLKGA
ncbi:MAG: sigma-70 family RNA polymerase sigma factor [Prevotella sp.]|jgi:RNA polymerase sigma factor (sigma-70 family)|nr:sigma-70 family RNA polymerase sigma factor [Prevotella sp.]